MSPTPSATQHRHGLTHTGADGLLFVRELVLGVVPKFRWEIHPTRRQLEQTRHRAARRFRNRTAYQPCDLEYLLRGWKAALDVLWVVPLLSFAHLGKFPATPPR